jgi:hypothetical protein
MSQNLENEVAALSKGVAQLNEHKVFRAHGSWGGLLWFNFLRGLAFGFGSVVGATVLVALAVYMLSSIDFVPVIGEWARDIIEVIQAP